MMFVFRGWAGWSSKSWEKVMQWTWNNVNLIPCNGDVFHMNLRLLGCGRATLFGEGRGRDAPDLTH
jgi:hypothetical protein